MRQREFSFFKKQGLEFGGSLLQGKRKTARPLSVKRPLHLVLKSTGSAFFNPGNRKLEKLLRDHAKKYSIRIYELSFNWSHAHIILKLPTFASYKAFIRTVTAAVVHFLSKQCGKNLKGIFDLRPFTRILNWGRDLRNAMANCELNELEGWGLISRKKKSGSIKKKKGKPPETS